MYSDYVSNPWTRNGQVQAQVVQVVPRVSGPIIDLPLVDNQLVTAGQLLFRIDSRTYKAAVEQAQAQLAYNQAVLAVTRGLAEFLSGYDHARESAANLSKSEDTLAVPSLIHAVLKRN